MHRLDVRQPGQRGRTVSRENVSGSGGRIKGNLRNPATGKDRGTVRARGGLS